MTKLLCLIFAIAASAGHVLGQTDANFAKANREYAAGHYIEAADAYEQCVRSGQWSANLFYDLGNAYFHTKNFGRAILNYQRALQLDGHHPEAQANLRIARDEARALEIVPSKAERVVALAGTNDYAIAAAASLWVALFCLIGWILSTRRSKKLIAVGALSFAIFILTVAAVFIVQNGRNLAIVIGADTRARLATADNAQTVLALPAGSEVKVLSRRADWIYAALPNDLHGWIPAKDAELVRL